MMNWKKKSQRVGYVFTSATLCFLTFASFSVGAREMISEKYLFSFKTHKSTCILRVNDFPAVDNTKIYSGTMSAGFNLTAFLENGNNDIELLMTSQDHEDPKTLYPDSSCEVVVSKASEAENKHIARFTLSVNDKGEITAKNSPDYHGGAFTSKILEGYTKNEKDLGLYKLESSVIAKGLPRWAWADATPVTNNDIPKIKSAYEQILSLMHKRDIDSLKALAKISSEEMAYAEGTSPEIIFASTDFPQHVFDKAFTPVPIEWSRYKLLTYRGGRLFRFGVGFTQNSPLRFKNAEGKQVFSYNPYFSIINGKVVLVR